MIDVLEFKSVEQAIDWYEWDWNIVLWFFSIAALLVSELAIFLLPEITLRS